MPIVDVDKKLELYQVCVRNRDSINGICQIYQSIPYIWEVDYEVQGSERRELAQVDDTDVVYNSLASSEADASGRDIQMSSFQI